MSDNLASAEYHIEKVYSLTSRDHDSRKHTGLADLHLKLDIARSLQTIAKAFEAQNTELAQGYIKLGGSSAPEIIRNDPAY